MNNHSTKLGWPVLSALVIAALAGAGLAAWSGSGVALVTALLLAGGTLVAAVALMQMRLRAAEADEAREIEELKRSRGGAALFELKEGSLRARRAREQFDRWFVTVFAVLLGLAQGGLAWWLWRWLPDWRGLQLDRAAAATGLFALLAFLLFLLGRYAAALAQHERRPLLRPGASWVLAGALGFTAAAVAAALAWGGYPAVDQVTARVLAALPGVLALETFLNLLLEWYRPRTRGEARPVYESRVLGLLSRPADVVSTVAGALDYQFGFKISETWFYRWLERGLAGLVLLQLTVVWLFTAFVMVEPHEQALLERFGRPVAGRGTLGPGLHLKFPWPVDRARVFPAREAGQFNVGFTPDPILESQRTLLWTRAHYKEEVNLLVASREQDERAPGDTAEQAVPVNLLTASIPVQYEVTNLTAWLYGHAAPATLLEQLATREVTHYLVSVDVDDIMSAGRRRAAEELRALIQAAADQAGLGARILFVGLQDIHPPVSVADAYEAVIGATQEREKKMLDAQGYHAETTTRAAAEARRVQLAARGARAEVLARAGAASGAFTNQLAAFRSSPRVYPRRLYLDTFARSTVETRKYILTTTNRAEALWLNLEDKLRADLLDITVPPAPK